MDSSRDTDPQAEDAGPADHTVSTLAGARFGGFADKTGATARFFYPRGLACGTDGLLYVADSGNNRIRTVQVADGAAATFAGSAAAGFADGDRATALFHNPAGIAAGPDGIWYVADTFNHAIRQILPDGTVRTLAGTGTPGHTDGPAGTAQFSTPTDVAVRADGTVVVIDQGNHCVRLIGPDAEVSTLAGSGAEGFADGTGSLAQFAYPYGVAVTTDGTALVTDSANHRVRAVGADGTVSSLAGSGGEGSTDGADRAAGFSSPEGLAAGPSGTLFIADTGGHTVRRRTSHGQVDTLAGDGSKGSEDGPARFARFQKPTGVAVDPATGAVYVSDQHSIRVIEP